MSNTLIINTPQVLSGLATMTYTVPAGAGGAYNVQCTSTELPPSGLSVVINDNGSPIYTSPTLGQTQSEIELKFSFLAAAADVITVVLTGNAADALANNTKSTISIAQGF